jgi:hypothetical protein
MATTTPSKPTKPIDQPGDVLEKLPPLPRTFVVRYEDGNEREITCEKYEVTDEGFLRFLDRTGRSIAHFRRWASVETKFHDTEHPERGSDVSQ